MLTSNQINLIFLPCGGIEKKMGIISFYVTQKLLERKNIKNLKVQPSLPQISAKMKGISEELQNSIVFGLNGCATQCVTKILSEAQIQPAKIISLAKLIKSTGYIIKPEPFMTKEELNQLPILVDELESMISRFIAPKSDSVSYTEFQFKPDYETWSEYSKSKFKFKVPHNADSMLFTWNDAWAYRQGDIVVIGISDYMQQRLSDIIIAELPEIGQKIDQLDATANVESTKTVQEILSPFTGEIIAINRELEESPELINEDPYNKGWVCAIKISDYESERDNLMSSEEYFEYMKEKVDEEE